MALYIDVLDADADRVRIATNDALLLALAGASPMYRIAAPPMQRPADALQYDVGDSISSSPAPGSVAANVVALAAEIDMPFTVEAIRLTTTDTGPAVVEAYVELVLFDADPTAGVRAGDNAPYDQDIAGVVGIFAGTFEPATSYFSGGSTAMLAPARGTNRHIMLPAPGTVNVWWQIKTMSQFVPAPSSLWTPAFEGFRGRV